MSELERNESQAAVIETAEPAHHIGTEVLFSAKDITKTFGGTKALKGVELEVHAGEIVGLVGENGAGKSTLLKIIIGAQPQTSGTISAADAVMQSARDELIPGKLICAIMAVVIVIVFVAMLHALRNRK